MQNAVKQTFVIASYAHDYELIDPTRNKNAIAPASNKKRNLGGREQLNSEVGDGFYNTRTAVVTCIHGSALPL